MPEGFIDHLRLQLQVVDDERDGNQEWDAALAAFQEAAARLVAHPNAGRLDAVIELPVGDPAGMRSFIDVVKPSDSVASGPLFYELVKVRGQWQVAELVARANRGYAEMRGVAALVRWGKMSTKDESLIAKYLGRRLIESGYWERTEEEGVLYWMHWRTGRNPAAVDMDEACEEDSSQPMASQEPVDPEMVDVVGQPECMPVPFEDSSEGEQAVNSSSLEPVKNCSEEVTQDFDFSLEEHTGQVAA